MLMHTIGVLGVAIWTVICFAYVSYSWFNALEGEMDD